ncbi:MAG TPA: carboxypeptidase-like regulatory domain-containing protein [Rubricoccaceae bacterium]
MLLFLLALPGIALAQGTGTLAGQVFEADGATAVIGANVRIGGTSLGAATDIDGNYRINGVPVGTYDITASYAGYPANTITGVIINPGATRQLNFTLQENTTDVVEVSAYVVPLITNDAVGQSRVVTGEDLENLPIRNVAATVALQGGIVNTEGSSELNIRGGRAEEVQYIVDGVRVTGGQLGVNQQAIEQQEVLIGTIPARYGDVQSGVISITTKTGRNDFFGSVEAVTSTGLDSFGYNLGSISLGGPIIANRLGFFLSAEGQSTEDATPYGADTYRLNDAAYDALQANPQAIQIRTGGTVGTNGTVTGGTLSFIPFPSALVGSQTGITTDSLQTLLLANGTLQAGQTIANPNLRSGTEVVSVDQFDLVRGKSDPLRDLTLNGNLNFTFGDVGLRLGGNYVTRKRELFSFANSLYNRDLVNIDNRESYRAFATVRQRLSNTAFYQLQGEYQDGRTVLHPNTFSDNIEDVLRYGDISDPSAAVATRYYTLVGGEYVPQFTEDGGGRPARVVNSFGLPGRTNLTVFQKSRNQQYRFSGSATAQVGVNQIEFGGEFQQETRRFFSLNGAALASFVNDGDAQPVSGTALPGEAPQFPNGITSYDQLDFNTIRAQDPTRFGYDYLGIREVNDQDINSYFPDPVTGLRSNTDIAPYRPIYYAGYIQDKIELQDLVVQLGLRVDVFDNNTSVLKDIYALRPIQRAGDLDSAPTGIGSDFAVYYGGGAIVGYRDLDGNFYDAAGTRTTFDVVTQDRRGDVLDVPGGTVADLFKPYEAQVTVMPRVGVSFPVTDRALFFASYNVTSQRPTETAFASLSDFEAVLQSTQTIANSSLRPERTTQYELGFRQRLGERAAISLSGFYRTQENKITQRRLEGGAPGYTTYLNEDFTTTQGGEVNFDLRRVNNLQVSANYTLSFAQGTGSDANSTSTAAWRGNYFPQFINPSDFDQRHTANVTLDYRFAGGEGPMIGGIRPFENFGVNLIGQFGSGQRYTRLQTNISNNVGDSSTPDVSGTINGSTLPATTRLDLRIDRAFNLGFSDSRLRAYLQVQNLLDTRNRLAVYRATGQSDEDGFASTETGQTLLNTPGRLFNYQAYTGGPVNVGGQQSSGAGSFYSAPRQIRLGVLFDF